MSKIIIFMLSAILIFTGCSSAKVSTEKVAEMTKKSNEDLKPYPEFTGTKSKITILKFEIPDELVKKYPELADKKVGWGLYNRLIEGFYDTKRFELLEDKKEVMAKIIEQWKYQQQGIVVDNSKDEEKKIMGTDYFVYAEVFDFSVSKAEEIAGVDVKKKNTTIVGVQIKIVNNAGEYIPASGIGTAITEAQAVWASPTVEFDQTTVGLATQKAVNIALHNLMDRLK